MEDMDFWKIAGIVLKVLFWLFVGSAVLYIICAMLSTAINCIYNNDWVSWALGIGLIGGIIWYNVKRDS